VQTGIFSAIVAIFLTAFSFFTIRFIINRINVSRRQTLDRIRVLERSFNAERNNLQASINDTIKRSYRIDFNAMRAIMMSIVGESPSKCFARLLWSIRILGLIIEATLENNDIEEFRSSLFEDYINIAIENCKDFDDTKLTEDYIKEIEGSFVSLDNINEFVKKANKNLDYTSKIESLKSKYYAIRYSK